MSDATFEGEFDVNQDDSQEDVMTPAELIAKLEEVSETITRSFCLTTKCLTSAAVTGVAGLLSSSLAGLVEWEVLAGAVGEQIGGGGVRDGAADSHGEFTAAAAFSFQKLNVYRFMPTL